jgi:hypothetical protein
MMPNPVHWSLRAYRRLLCLYPPGFRSEYGEEMTHVFGDVCREGYERQGGRGVAGVWVETAPDMLTSALDEHAREDFAMARPQLAKLLSIGGFVAGALWIAFALLANMRAEGMPGFAYRNLDDIIVMFFAALPFLAATYVAVYLRLASVWSAPAKITWLLVIAGVLWMLVMSPIKDEQWFVFIAGYFVMFVGLVLTGILLLTQRAMWSYAAIFLGIGVSCVLFNTESNLVLFAAVAGMLFIALAALTFRDRSEPHSGWRATAI